MRQIQLFEPRANPPKKGASLIFQPDMIRANQAGLKTQTRRLVKGYNSAYLEVHKNHEGWNRENPYGEAPGALVWVRENVNITDAGTSDLKGFADVYRVVYTADGDAEWAHVPIECRLKRIGVKPSIHMSRWMSRMTLELKQVRIERLQDISDADALAEGVQRTTYWCENKSPKLCYADLIDSINGSGTWKKNPWVWVISYKLYLENIDDIIQIKKIKT